MKMRKRAEVLLTLLMAVVMLSSCTTSFPKKESVAVLSNEEAAKVLKDKTRKDIIDRWGNPDGELSGIYGDIYEYNSKLIVIYYDSDSIVTNVLISDKQN